MQGSKEARENLMRGVHLLNIFHQSNAGRSVRLPHAEFYNKVVSQTADLAQEYMIWRHLLVSQPVLFFPLIVSKL